MTKKNNTPADFQPIENAAAVKSPRRRRNTRNAADLPAAELPAAELPPPPDAITLPDFSPLPDTYYNNANPVTAEAPLTPADFLEEPTPTSVDGGGSAAANAAKEELEEIYKELEQRLRLGLPFNYVILMNHWSRPEAHTLESFKKRFIEAFEKTYDATPLEVLLGRDRGKTNKALLGMATAKSVDAFTRSINSLRRARNDGAEGAEDLLSKRLKQELQQAIEERKTALKALREFARVWRPAKELRERIKSSSLTTLVDDDLLTDARALQRRSTTSDLLRLVRIQLNRLNALD